MADFSTLAGLAKPTMMPTSPMGLGPGALEGAMYGTDKARHTAFLEEAAKEAKLKAAMDAMKAEEASLAQPGRMADIQLKNASSQDNLDAYSTDGAGRDLAFGAIENKGLGQEKEMKAVLEPLFNAVGGKDEDKAREAYNMLVTKVKKLKNVSFETMRKTMQAEQYGKTEANPTQINKEAIENIRETGRNTRSADAITSREKIAQARMAYSKLIAEARTAVSAGKPLTASQQEALDVSKMYDTPEERVAYWYGKSQNTAATAIAAGRAKTANELGVDAVSPPIKSGPPPAKSAPKPAAEANFTVLPEGSPEPKVGSTHNGKKVKRVQKSNLNRIRVEYE